MYRLGFEVKDDGTTVFHYECLRYGHVWTKTLTRVETSTRSQSPEERSR